MPYIFVGLGNPGKEYEETRHNTGRMILEWLGESFKADWKEDRKLKVKSAKVKVGKQSVILLLPDTFMNNSGKAVRPFVENLKQAEKIVVIYDDLDLPFGKVKISFNKSSGGHKGLESVIKALKTEKFPRIRVGISPKSSDGKMRKPMGEDAVAKHILGKFKPEEIKELRKISKKINTAILTLVSEGLEKAMTELNR